MLQQEVNDEIDLKALLSILLTYWKLILSSLILGLMFGIFYAKNYTPTYRANSLIQVDKKTQGISGLGTDVANLLQADASPAQTEIEILKSRMVIWPVIKNLHLDITLKPLADDWIKKLPFVKNNDIIHTQAGVGAINGQVWITNFNVSNNYYGQIFTLTSLDGQNYQLTTDDIKGKGSDPLVIKDPIDVKGKVGEPLVIKTANGQIEIMVKSLGSQQSYQLTKQSPSAAVDSLKARFNVIEQGKLTGVLYTTLDGINQDEITQTLGDIVQTYKKQNDEKSSAETSQTLTFMQEQLPKLQQKLANAQNEFNKFREKNGTVDITKESEVAINERAALQTSLRELQLKHVELSERFTSEYPVLKQLEGQIEEIMKKEKQLDDRLVKIPEIQRQFLDLSNDVKISSEIYLNMLKNYEQLQIVKSGQMGYVRIVDMPISNYEPVGPKKILIVFLASLIGLLLGVGLAFLKSLFNTGIKDVETLETQIGLPIIGVIPHTSKLSKLLSYKKDKLALLQEVDAKGISNEAIKSLRTHLIFTQNKPIGNKIMITSAGPKVGKSFIAANLAVALAMAGKKVLLIDADTGLGHLQQYFSSVNGYGLTDYLTDDALNSQMVIPEGLIQRTTYEGLEFMPRGRYHKNASELFLTGRFEKFIELASNVYDYIIINTPPIMGASDALAVGQLVDYVLFITRYGVSTAKQVNFSVERLQRVNIEVQGLVFNDTQQSIINSYNYHYGYKYRTKKAQS